MADLSFLVLAAVLLLLTELTREFRWPNSATNSQRSYPAPFLLRDLDSASFVMEQVLRPCVQFERKNSTVFIRDSDLGWKYQPEVKDFS